MREDADRMQLLAPAALLDVNSAIANVDRYDLAEVAIDGQRELQPVPFTDAGLLSREAVSIDDTAPDRLTTPDVPQTRERRLLVEECLVGQLAEPEELPPHALFLSPVPVEHVREQPPRLLLVGALLPFEGHAFEQCLHDLAHLDVACRDLFTGLTLYDFGSRNRHPAGLLLRAQALEPAIQP